MRYRLSRMIALSLLLPLATTTAMTQKGQPDTMPVHSDLLVGDSTARNAFPHPGTDSIAAPLSAGAGEQQQQDSIAHLLKRIELLEARLQQQQRQIAFADTCIVRQANNALNAPYDERRLNSAIAAFDRISSPAYKEEMMPLRRLLDNYGLYYHEIIDILQRANADRNMKNPFAGKQTAEQYIAEIKQTQYYQQVMQQEWVIPFLTNLTQNAIGRLEDNDPGEHKHANLKDLLKP